MLKHRKGRSKNAAKSTVETGQACWSNTMQVNLAEKAFKSSEHRKGRRTKRLRSTTRPTLQAYAALDEGVQAYGVKSR